MTEPADRGDGGRRRIVVGKISGIFGVSGWVRVMSYTRPPENLLTYPNWQIHAADRWEVRRLQQGRPAGKGLVVSLEGLTDRDEARLMMGSEIAVYRDEMPALPQGQYYWCDLTGLQVRNREGVVLGVVSEIQETGANDVLVVEGDRRHLIPLVIPRHVLNVDLQQGVIEVDWSGDYL